MTFLEAIKSDLPFKRSVNGTWVSFGLRRFPGVDWIISDTWSLEDYLATDWEVREQVKGAITKWHLLAAGLKVSEELRLSPGYTAYVLNAIAKEMGLE